MGLTCSWKVVEAARNQEEENGKSPAGFAPFSKMKNSASNTWKIYKNVHATAFLDPEGGSYIHGQKITQKFPSFEKT
jgi:hypothetical protein